MLQLVVIYKLAFGTNDRGISLRADFIHKYSLRTVMIVEQITIINQNKKDEGNEPTYIQLNMI